jgi:cell division septum initiation protein DivIVA
VPGALTGPQEVLGRLTATVREARALPMSASCVVNRAEVLGMLEELQARLPEALDRAEEVLGDRTAVVQDGRREAEQVLATAQAERERLLGRTEVLRGAEAEAAAILEDAVATAALTRAEADDYVERGRHNLAETQRPAAQVLETLRTGQGDDRPLPG